MAFDIGIEQGPRGSRLYVLIGARCPGIVLLHGSAGHHLRPETERMHDLRIADSFGGALIDDSL